MAEGKFHFSVLLGDGLTGQFQEVTGITADGDAVDFREGTDTVPGLGKVVNVTMRKGIFAGDAKFWAWYNEIKMNTSKRRNATINLLDASGAPKVTWTLNNAWVTKITGPDRKVEGNEVAIESLELAHETIEVSAP
jgi:phage tail-like protein